jgi:two-component system LytT family sensor kinase
MVEQHEVNLLVKLAVATSLASILVRFRWFKTLLMAEQRSIQNRLQFALGIAVMFGGAVAVRVITGTYMGADVGLEGSFIAGLTGGYVSGLVAGILISIAPMQNGELLSMVLFAAVGVLGGLVRDAAPHPGDIYNVSPFPDRSVWIVIRHWKDHHRAWFHAFLVLSIAGVELLRYASHHALPQGAIFVLYPESPAKPAAYALVWLATALAILLPIKIWANARTELKLQEQERLLQEARLRALMSQINPHFLFNTLNSVASLVRTDPGQARVVIHKLSSILRRLMRKHDNFTSLREELAFIDDYLSIEMVRFGDKLRFHKEVEPDALDARVPSMLLQPIVENSLKHGLAGKVEGGEIRLRIWRANGRLHLEISDDGIGIAEANLAKLFEQGIGVSNVNERLKVLFGSDYRMWIDSKQGEGTRTGIEIPGGPPEMARAS